MPNLCRVSRGDGHRLGRSSVQQFAEFEHRDERKFNGFPGDHGLSVTSYDDRSRRHEPEIADTHAGEHGEDRRS